MQGRKESFFSLFLAGSMNMFCRIKKYGQLLSYQESLDDQDDIEREKMKGLLIEKRSMDRYFSKKFLKASKEGGNIEDIIKEMDTFNSNYEKRLWKIWEIRDHLEEEDDKTRKILFNHTDKCHHNIREENSKIEKRLIQENLNKKLSNSNV